jgi:hypothetical protein
MRASRDARATLHSVVSRAIAPTAIFRTHVARTVVGSHLGVPPRALATVAPRGATTVAEWREFLGMVTAS